MQNDRIAMLIKRATIATDSSKKLSSQLTAAERERDAMKALLAIERQRATEMTQVAENARAQLASKEIQLQR